MTLLFLTGGSMRTLLALLAASAGGMVGAYVYGSYIAPNMPDAVAKNSTVNALVSGAIVSVPAVIAYGLVAGIHHNKVGLPAKA